MSETAVPVSLRALFAGPAGRRAPDAPPAADMLAAAAAAARAEALAEAEARIASIEAEAAAARSAAAAAAEAQDMACAAACTAVDAAFADAVVPLALAIAARLVEAEPASTRLAEALFREAVDGLDAEGAGVIRMHPELAEALDPVPAGWRLVPDPSLDRGTAVAEAGPRLAQAGLAQRFGQLADALMAEASA